MTFENGESVLIWKHVSTVCGTCGAAVRANVMGKDTVGEFVTKHRDEDGYHYIGFLRPDGSYTWDDVPKPWYIDDMAQVHTG